MYLSACSDKAARYVNDSSDYTSFGIDLHDIDSVIANNTKSLLQSSYVKEMKSKKLLAISNIINQTHEDIECYCRKWRNHRADDSHKQRFNQ